MSITILAASSFQRAFYYYGSGKARSSWRGLTTSLTAHTLQTGTGLGKAGVFDLFLDPDGLLDGVDGFVAPAYLGELVRQVVERNPFAQPVADLAGDFQTPLVELDRAARFT